MKKKKKREEKAIARDVTFQYFTLFKATKEFYIPLISYAVYFTSI